MGQSPTPLLTIEQLEQLKLRWEEHRITVAGHLRPGLGDAEMDALTAPLGIALPQEARVWWGWHDGAEPNTAGEFAMVAPGRIFLPLAFAVKHCEMLRQIVWTKGHDVEHRDWKPDWLPLNTANVPTILECGCARDAPVRAFGYDIVHPARRAPSVPSLGTLVDAYIEAYDSGAWWLNRHGDHGTWDADLQRLEAIAGLI